MTQSATATVDDYASEAIDDDDNVGVDARLAPASLGSRSALAVAQSQSHFADALRSEIDFLVNARARGDRYLRTYALVSSESVIWRLVAAVTAASSILAIGALLFAVALTGSTLHPNPYVALALFLVGIALCLTMATVVRGAAPRGRRRRR